MCARRYTQRSRVAFSSPPPRGTLASPLPRSRRLLEVAHASRSVGAAIPGRFGRLCGGNHKSFTKKGSRLRTRRFFKSSSSFLFRPQVKKVSKRGTKGGLRVLFVAVKQRTSKVSNPLKECINLFFNTPKGRRHPKPDKKNI